MTSAWRFRETFTFLLLATYILTSSGHFNMFYNSTHPVKMRDLLTLLVVCVASLCVRCDYNVYTLMDRVVVVMVPHHLRTMPVVPLVCGGAYQDQDVFWKRNDARTKLVGNRVSVVVQEMMGGNFSCHLSQDGRYLNHTLVLVQLNPDNRSILLKSRSQEGRGPTKHILCSGHNFNGSFRCSWSSTRPNAAVLLVKAERNSSEIDCELEAGGSGVWCNERSCAAQEEKHRVVLRVYIYSGSRLEMYLAQFYLRDIVSPERVAHLHKVKDNEFHWGVPESWEKPCSYYQVQFEVKAVRGAEGSCLSPSLIKGKAKIIDEKQFMVKVKTKKYMFCVRARDKYSGGPWGEWSMKKH